MHVHLLALEGTFDMGLSAFLDALGMAGELGDGPTFEVVGVRRRVRTFHGFAVPLGPPQRDPDLVLVSALGEKDPPGIANRLTRRDVRDAGALLRAHRSDGVPVGAACTATWVLGHAGVLDGQPATTSWWLAPAFRRRFPSVRLDPDAMVVRGEGVITAGAALAHLDLALHVIRQVSPDLAHQTARYLVSSSRTSQAAYRIPDQLQHDDPMVRRFEGWVRDHLDQPFTVAEAARAVGTSPRSLARRLHTVLGRTPIEVVRAVRVDVATYLLRTSDASVDEIAAQVGYAQGATLRTVLRRATGLGVRAIRAGQEA